MKKSNYDVVRILLTGLIQMLVCIILYVFNIPNPNVILFVFLSAALVRYGYAEGIACGVITFLYSMFFFSIDHSWLHYTPLNKSKLIMIGLGIIANILIIGQLHKKSLIAEKQIAILEMEKQNNITASDKERQLFNALTINYTAAYFCDLLKDSLDPVKQKEFSHSANLLDNLSKPNSYSEWIRYCYENLVIKEESPDFLDVLDSKNLMERLKTEESFTYRHKTVPNRAGMQYFEITVVRLYTDEHSFQIIMGYSPIDRIIAEEKERNEKLQEALVAANKANLAKTTFLLNMSHDIRTPLNGIIGLLKINETHSDNEALVKENREKMKKAADHLISLINDVLQMSKLENGTEQITLESVDLNDVSHDIVAIIRESATENGITWEFSGDKELRYPYIMTSPLHLRQIFLNIYGNSIKFTKSGGTISTCQECLGVDEVSGRVIYRWIISDTGTGMRGEFIKRIFEPFSQEKTDARSVYHGTGLGMAIVKGLIEQMGGTIQVSSEQGVGSTFTITIPFEIATEPVRILDEAVVSAEIDGLHLMLVEDNELNAEIAETLLKDQGAKVATVPDGEKAVKLFEENPEGIFDVILMDVMMPVMDGITATKTIRKLDCPDAKIIPIIAMTANAFKEDEEKCLAAGMNAHLAKPLNIEKVKQTICKLVKKNTENVE